MPPFSIVYTFHGYVLQIQADELPAQTFDTLSSALCSNIALLFDDPASSDVVLTAGDTTVHAHKTILAAQSPTFRAMFQASTVDALSASCLSCVVACRLLGMPAVGHAGCWACQLLWHVNPCVIHHSRHTQMVLVEDTACASH